MNLSIQSLLLRMGLSGLLCVVVMGIGFAQTPTLLKDINTLLNNSVGNDGSNPRFLTNVNGTLYFTATDNGRTTSLWKSNGTTAGTTKIVDLPGTAYQLTAVGNTLFFVADDPAAGYELWKSNGTAATTFRLKDIYPGVLGSMPDGLTAVNNLLYFVANDPMTGSELWRSDGTNIGTVLVKDIAFGNVSSEPQQLKAINGQLYFSANSGATGQELWRSDGTTAGTVLIRDINTGSEGSNPQQLTNLNGTVYFVAKTAANGCELWKSNGTAVGTVLVKDIWVGNANGMPHFLTAVGNFLYFAANDGIRGKELWRTDGTAGGTALVKEIVVGATGGEPRYLKNIAGTLFFSATNGVQGQELWKSDGTAGGTTMVKDIRAGGEWGNSQPMNFIASKGAAYFLAYDDINGQELWKSDGTAAGTLMIDQLRIGKASSAIRNLTAIGDTLYFTGSDVSKGTEVRRLNPCKLIAKITNKPTIKFCGGTKLTLRAQANDCAGNQILWNTTLTQLAANDTTLNVQLPDVVSERKFKIVLSASISKEIVKDSVEITVIPRTRFQLLTNDTTICHHGPISLVQMVKNYASFSSPSWRRDSLTGVTITDPTRISIDSAQTAYFLTASSLQGCRDTARIVVRLREIPKSLGHLRVVLEGAYVVGTGRMHTKLNEKGLLPGQILKSSLSSVATPALQPYAGYPWYYAGSEKGGQYEANITDWVYVTLRTKRDDPTSIIFRTVGLLQNDGYVASVTGCPNKIKDLDWYYVGVEHRNHIPIVAASPSLFINGGFFYDFSINQSYIPDDSPGIGQKFFDGRYMMYAGDAQKGTGFAEVNAVDLGRWQRDNGKINQYLATDLNLDGEVNALDKILWAINNGLFNAIRF